MKINPEELSTHEKTTTILHSFLFQVEQANKQFFNIVT